MMRSVFYLRPGVVLVNRGGVFWAACVGECAPAVVHVNLGLLSRACFGACYGFWGRDK